MSNYLAPWRTHLYRALHLNNSLPHSRYFQLATVTVEGLPQNRTVVFRGFLENTNQIKIVTDLRSEKVNQIQHQSWGEICWYFTQTREQFRLMGKLLLITENHPDSNLQQERLLTWQQLSDAARSQFAWPAPKKPRIKDSLAFSSLSPSCEHPLNNFCLLLLDPEQVEHLELREDPHNRVLYFLDQSQSWQVEEVNP